MKTRLNPISASSSHFQCKYWLFIGITHTRRIPGRSGEQTLPLTPQPSRGNAALAAFPRPGCGQVATPCWWVALVLPSDFICSWIFSLGPEFWWNGLRFFGFNRSILRGFFSTSFQPLDFALILWARINSDLIQNFGGLWAHFSSSL